MERRAFIHKLLSALALGGLFLAAGCHKEEKIVRPGNQDKLWKMATGQVKAEESVELAYAKDTPALFRDASMGKEDPSFKPQTGGG
ncbi:MAG: hypothetical protein HXY45_01710 [Syntrophaceae bacterium]|jgi:hypothetical protein|nr:hypothetical protein [Syntrophaceae bacterium]